MKFLDKEDSCILIVDDEQDVRQQISGLLSDDGYQIIEAKDGQEALQAVKQTKLHLVILDIWLNHSDYDGLQVLKMIKRINASLPVIMISGHSTIDIAVSSLKQGAFQFLTKPFKADILLFTVQQALFYNAMRKENYFLRSHFSPFCLSQYVGESLEAKSVRSFIKRVSKMDSRILIEGGVGVGKTHLASVIHNSSARASWSFITVDCRNVTEQNCDYIFEGGDASSSFLEDSEGCFDRSCNGTLLFKHISCLPYSVQERLAQIIHRKKMKKTKDNYEKDLDIRFICTTRVNLEDRVREGLFHEELYNLINMSKMTISPLSHRVEDISVLFTTYVDFILRKKEGEISLKETVNKACFNILTEHEWFGNVKELFAFSDKVLLYAESKGIDIHLLTEQDFAYILYHRKMTGGDGDKNVSLVSGLLEKGVVLKKARDLFEKEFIIQALKKHGNNVTKTAQALGVDRAALHRKIKSFN